MRLDCVSIQALVEASDASAKRWVAANPRDDLAKQVTQAVARAQGLLPLLLPVSNRNLADRHWAAIFALLQVRILLYACKHRHQASYHPVSHSVASLLISMSCLVSAVLYSFSSR